MTQFGKRDPDLKLCVALVEPLRRRLFLYLIAAAEPVGRDKAAAALGVARSVAAFHLDKLAEAGVLAVEYRRQTGRTGPGAGRPAKLYRVVKDEFAFNVPERRYELAAAVLAHAVTEADVASIPVADALRKAARRFGCAMSEDFGDSSGTTAQDDLERIAGVLDPYGYQPCVGSGRITLGNCPYRALTAEYRGVVCRMNLRLLKGVLKGAGTKDLSARPDPSAAPCCVTITAR